ncbi:hypothetical protein GPECTOR_58g552 [Gonium pectorale]|uniref:Agmatine deiminase n=1 Tax=Gonium pectorale TaxID=33097 RepID=A0A150G5Q9_GONPE|nr:hypothetical protein GPECTOR_58g552 [Gonium pectorale]|eukprot:KXZ45103.1 hypothetical protein GPECTOR_58g552 [Gonium pectorale]
MGVRRKLGSNYLQCWHCLTAHRTDSVWIRDYGPTLYLDRGKPKLFQYAYYDRRPRDDDQPRSFADWADLPLTDSGLYMEGGNLLSNGEVCITSDAVLSFNFPYTNNVERKRKLLVKALRKYGCAETIVLESLEDEATGHVDIWLAFASRTTLIAGVFREDQHAANAAIMGRNLDLLRSRFQIVPIPMPDPVQKRDRLVMRTYANMLFLNDVVLVPTYDGHEAQGVIDAVQAATGKRVVTFHGENIIKEKGTIHCLSKTIPRV